MELISVCVCVFQGPSGVKMANSVASYDQLVRQVEDLRKENSHLRRELQDNSHHLSKLENETSDMKVRQLTRTKTHHHLHTSSLCLLSMIRLMKRCTMQAIMLMNVDVAYWEMRDHDGLRVSPIPLPCLTDGLLGCLLPLGLPDADCFPSRG